MKIEKNMKTENLGAKNLKGFGSEKKCVMKIYSHCFCK